MRQTFTKFEPNAFPTATSILSVKAARIETERAGSDEQKATKTKPTVVLPNLAISEIFTALVIVMSLALSNSAREPTRIRALMTGSSNKGIWHLQNNFA
jgi:hypothetical protein